MPTTFTTLDRIAVHGNLARPTRGERLIKGTINGDKMTLMFRETTLGKRTVTRNRVVFCERCQTPDDGDFFWQGVQQTVF